MKFILVRLKSNSVRNNNVYWNTPKIIFEGFQQGAQAIANSKDSSDSDAAWVKRTMFPRLKSEYCLVMVMMISMLQQTKYYRRSRYLK